MAAGLALIAGCRENPRYQGAPDVGNTPGIWGGATGYPSGTSEAPEGSGGGGLPPAHPTTEAPPTSGP